MMRWHFNPKFYKSLSFWLAWLLLGTMNWPFPGHDWADIIPNLIAATLIVIEFYTAFFVRNKTLNR